MDSDNISRSGAPGNQQTSNANSTNVGSNQYQSNQQTPPIESFIPGQATNTGQTSTAEQENKTEDEIQQAIKKSRKRIPYIAGFIILLFIGIFAFYQINKPSQPYHLTTSILTTTVKQQQVLTQISNCTTISSPGKYYLSKSISVSLPKGACIYVDSSNVEIIGNYNKIKGNGPFVGVPPFTYGIEVVNASNVTINSVNVTQFSFGIYFYNVSNSRIEYSNVTKNTMSNIFLNDSYSNNIEYTTAALSSSSYGSIYILGGGKNLFYNDSIYNNAYYGFSVNSTGNQFIGDSLSGNPNDFICYKNAGFKSSNIFSNVKCSNNLYCNFAWCSHTNAELNISQIVLNNSISSCGAIKGPGIYKLSSNITATNYFNMSNPNSRNIACISLDYPNIVLNCNNHTISNAGYGISLSGNYNDTIENCIIKNSTIGIYLNSSFYPKLLNITILNNTYGLYINGMDSGSAFYVRGKGNTYGAFINNTNSFTLSNFNFSKNNYGIYANTGGSNIFNNGVSNYNKYGDIYCTASSYNESPSAFTGISCGLTDCNWASCAKHALPPISVYPLNNCTTITIPGTYALSSNIRATPNCFNIETGNVSFNCNNNYIVGTGSGSAFTIYNVSNVQISNCRIRLFNYGLNVKNANYITIQNINMSKVGYGIYMQNSNYSKIIGDSVEVFYNGGFNLIKVLNSIISGNSANNGVNGSNGFTLLDSVKNLISFNNATQNMGYGFFINNSRNNTISNNTAYGNKIDYYCSQNTSGIYAELNGVNIGNTKYNCHWLVELNSQSASLTPLSISTSSTLVLTQDILYPYGEVLYNIFNTKQTSANSTLINCNYHTIYASQGGIFANINNASNVKVENCYIKNFTYAIKGGTQSGLESINNTIANSYMGVSITSGSYPKIINNTILNSSYGMLLINTNYGTLKNNHIANSNISIELAGGSGYQVIGNKANYGNIGMYVVNSTTNIFENNLFENMSRYGIVCTGFASNATVSLNKDYGNNICSSNYQCSWMSSSNQCLS
jgi:parallel beta-helix repeat protein